MILEGKGFVFGYAVDASSVVIDVVDLQAVEIFPLIVGHDEMFAHYAQLIRLDAVKLE